MTVLKAALNHAHCNELVSHADEWGRVKPFRGAGAPREQYLSQDECQRLMNAAESGFRNLIRAALLTGCRYGELARLECRGFNP